MIILRRLKNKNMKKLRAFRETPNTPDEIRTMEKLKDKARGKGIYLLPEPEGVTGGLLFDKKKIGSDYKKYTKRALDKRQEESRKRFKNKSSV